MSSFASPYIKTVTVAVARSADLLTYTGADVANIKTLAATFSRGVGVSSTGAVAVSSNGTSAEYVDWGSFQVAGNNTLYFQGIDNSVAQWIRPCSNTYVPGATAKQSASLATNSIKFDFNGVAQTEDTAATIPTVTKLDIGHGNGVLVLNGPVNHIYGWTRNFSQSELGAVDRA